MWDEMYEEFWDKLEHFCARLCRCGVGGVPRREPR